MAIVVSDTSPIRAYAHLNRFDLLAMLFGEVLLPPAVVRELEIPTSKLPPLSIYGVSPFRVQAPIDRQSVARFEQTLDPGESEALALASELGARLLIDERDGQSVAARAGIDTIGTLGTLLLAKQRGLVPSVRHLMERLRDETRFRVTPVVFADVLARAGE